MPVRIAHITDTHLSADRPLFHRNFQIVAEELRRIRPDIVVNSGDVSLDGADSEADLALARDLHGEIGSDRHVIPGNHDVGDHPDVARKQPASVERLDRYRRIVGPDFWRIDIPGWRLLGLNALIIGSDLPGADEQAEMARAGTADLNGRSLAVFLHKPLADESYDETLESNRFLTAGPRRALLDALGETQPRLFLCGHVHQYRDTMIDGARHIWAPATSFMIGDPWQPGYGAKAVGYLLHEFHADGEHRHRLMAPRGLVHHDLVDHPEAYGDVRAWGVGNA